MSASSPLPVADDLVSQFKQADETGNRRWFQVEIQNESLVLVNSSTGSSSVENDFNSLSASAKSDTPCYYLFRLGLRDWVVITWVPECCPVKQKMVMASAKGHLKDKLGHAFFTQELHTTAMNELSYGFYQGTNKTVDSRSQSEIERDNVLKQEEKEREDLIKAQANKSAPSSASNSPITGHGGSSGYHSVNIPLSPSAKDALNQLKTTSSNNFLELIIDTTSEQVVAGKESNVSNLDMQNQINSAEPRFYIYNKAGTASPTRSFVFIYCCPPKSPPKLRMVYSTAKPSIAEQVSQLGLTMAPKRVEITEPSEVKDALAEASRPASGRSPTIPGANNNRVASPKTVPANGGVVKASNVPTVQGAHPVYSLLDSNNKEHPSQKKKIVMPPPGAW